MDDKPVKMQSVLVATVPMIYRSPSLTFIGMAIYGTGAVSFYDAMDNNWNVVV